MANSNTTHRKGWGGTWTEDKLECFEKYVHAYLTIMNKHRDKYKWILFYFDGFAGCGERELMQVEQPQELTLFGDDLPEKILPEYQGAAERVVQMEKQMRGFDYYYFIDKFDENLARLEFKLAKYETKGTKVFRAGDANDEVLRLAAYMRKHYEAKVLCLLDPFGMSVKWECINALAGTGVDLWILVPTGSIVNRLIQNDGKLRYPQKLEEFFGLPEVEIYNRFYYTQATPATLFDQGGEEEVKKVTNIINEIIQLYCDQLGTLFKYVTPEPLIMRNSNGLPIFHFVSASNNREAVKIAQQIIKNKQKKKR